MQAIILSIGDELASGLTINSNSAWLARQLGSIGIPTIAHITVGDDIEAIATAIREACAQLELEPSPEAGAVGQPPRRAGVLLISGGLGPTEDDVTRAALADALMQPLVEDPDAMLQIENWFKARARPMSPSNRLQALRPHGATIIENTAGTAPGLRAKLNDTHIFVTPGVPGEMQAMFAQLILPRLKEEFASRMGEARVALVRKINTFGMGESVLGEKIKDLMMRNKVSSAEFPASELETRNSKLETAVGTTVHDGIVSVRIYATGSAEAASAATERIREVVHDRLKAFIFSEEDESLESVVARLLLENRYTVATAESCTGGILAGLLTGIPGASGYFRRGWVTYANEAKHDELAVHEDLITKHGAVSEPVARAMAESARRIADTDFALATTGIAGPDGGTPDKPVGTVWIALATGDGGKSATQARRFIFPGNRQQVRMRASQMALAMLRWKLIGVVPPV